MEKKKMVKFRGLDCYFNENSEPITDGIGMVCAVYSFEAAIPKGKANNKGKTVLHDVTVDVAMRTMVDPETPHRDWLISANSFADLWVNACKRGERHVFEASMAKVGVNFESIGDQQQEASKTLMDMYAPRDYTANSRV
jgi:hypothetical protein